MYEVNLKMSYYSDTFNTIHKPSDTDEFYDGIHWKNFYEFLDYVFLTMNLDVQKLNYSLKTPKNILISFGKTEFRVFLGNDKAIPELNTIAYQTHEQDELPSLKKANKIGVFELGFKFDLFFDFKIDQFKIAYSLIEEIANKGKKEKLQKFYDICEEAQKILNHKYIDVTESDIAFFNCWLRVHQQIMDELNKGELVMNFNPRFQARNIVIKSNQAFYVLPFEDGPENAMQAIKDEISAQKIDCELIKSEDRFDPKRGNNIVENIWQDICASQFIIADISNRNPNVFYELGICDTIGKTVITICSKNSLESDYNNRLPFDIASQYTIIYEENYKGYSELKNEVIKRIRAILQNNNIQKH